VKFSDRFSERFRKRKEREQREVLPEPKPIAVDEARVFNLGPATHERGKRKLPRYPDSPVTSRQRRLRNRKRRHMRAAVTSRLPHGRTVKPYRG